MKIKDIVSGPKKNRNLTLNTRHFQEVVNFSYKEYRYFYISYKQFSYKAVYIFFNLVYIICIIEQEWQIITRVRVGMRKYVGGKQKLKFLYYLYQLFHNKLQHHNFSTASLLLTIFGKLNCRFIKNIENILNIT